MRDTNPEFGSAVAEVLRFLDATAETAGVVLGINCRTLAAMEQGIVPLRSLIIRFAEGVRRHCRGEGVPEWWHDPDAWLKLAGQGARSDQPANGAHRAAPSRRIDRWHTPPPDPGDRRPSTPASTPPPGAAPPSDPHAAAPAREHYRPVYERKTLSGGDYVHIFWLMDPADRRVFQITLRADEDYRARAAQVKQDLAEMEKFRFDRKYGRYRLPS